MANYPQGSRVRVWGRFYDDNDSLVDPANVFCAVRDPGENIDWYTGTGTTFIKDGTGEYYIEVVCDDPGRWYVSFWGTGTATAAEETSYRVTKRFAR